MTKEIFYLNLNPKENKYNFYNLICNPFEYDKHAAYHAMFSGVEKKIVPDLIRRFGLSEEVSKIIMRNTRKNCKYKITVNDSTLKILQFKGW